MKQFTVHKHNDTQPCRSIAQPQKDHRLKELCRKEFSSKSEQNFVRPDQKNYLEMH